MTQENKSATNYITKFDEYLNRCSAIQFESPKQTVSRFRSGLKDDYCRKLITRGITTLEHAYQLATDLDESRESYFHRIDFRDSSKITTASKPRDNQSFHVPTFAFSSLSVNHAGSSNAKLTSFEKKMASESVKVNPTTLRTHMPSISKV